MDVDIQPVIRVNFELREKDIAHFRERLAKARKNRALRDDDRVILGAEALVVKAMKSDPPTFVTSRMLTLQNMVDMIKDRDWRLEEDDRERVLEVLAYFADPNDMIPDEMPGVGFLDDVIMIDLAAYDLAPELEGYADFVQNQEDLKANLPDAQPTEVAREAFQSRMRRRRRRRAGPTGGEGGADLMTSLFHSG